MTYVETYSANLTIFYVQSHADKHLPVTQARQIHPDGSLLLSREKKKHKNKLGNVNLSVVGADSRPLSPGVPGCCILVWNSTVPFDRY